MICKRVVELFAGVRGLQIGLEGPPGFEMTNTQSSGVTNGSQVQGNSMLLKYMLKGGDWSNRNKSSGIPF